MKELMKLNLSTVNLYFGSVWLSHLEQVRKGGLPPLTRFKGTQILSRSSELRGAGVNRPSLIVLLFGDFCSSEILISPRDANHAVVANAWRQPLRHLHAMEGQQPGHQLVDRLTKYRSVQPCWANR
jgi:hypothetical protein